MRAAHSNGFSLGKLTGLTWEEIEGHAAETVQADGDVSYRGKYLCTVFNDSDGGDVLDGDGNPMSDDAVQSAIIAIDSQD